MVRRFTSLIRIRIKQEIVVQNMIQINCGGGAYYVCIYEYFKSHAYLSLDNKNHLLRHLKHQLQSAIAEDNLMKS